MVYDTRENGIMAKEMAMESIQIEKVKRNRVYGKIIDCPVKSNHSFFWSQINFLICLIFIILIKPVWGKATDLQSKNQAKLHEIVTIVQHSNDYQPLINYAGSKDIVLIGDSTHGTHEFYQRRINISKKLIKEFKFTLIAIEANWPDSSILNQYIQSQISFANLKKIDPFKNYPGWMWKNQEMLDFLHWLRQYNLAIPNGEKKVKLVGIDLYSYHRSINWVIDYFSTFYPEKSDYIKNKYQCLSLFKEPGEYGNALVNNQHRSCEQDTQEVLKIFTHCHIPCINFPDSDQKNAFFHAQQQAFIIQNNELYYRLMYNTDNPSVSWNIRDKYMFNTILKLKEFYNSPKMIVWAHNSHLGDARATVVSEVKQINVGQLLRQYFKERLFSIGMFTSMGDVIASDDWGQATVKKVLKQAHENSNESLFHQLKLPEFFFLTKQLTKKLYSWLNKKRLQRHVGVVYIAENEIDHHYSGTMLMEEFDAIADLNKNLRF